MPFKIDQHERCGEGINRTMATNNPEYPRGACWDLLNMVYDRTSEDPEKMGGYTRLGSTDVGGAVSGLFDYDEGTRLISTDIGGKIYEYAGSDWAQSTNGTGFNGEHNSLVRDDVLRCNNVCELVAPVQRH